MKKTKTIYAVTTGEYSGYYTVGMFSTKEKAEEYIESMMYPNEYNVEEYTLDELQPDRSEKMFCIRIDYENFNATLFSRDYPNEPRVEGLKNTLQMTDSGEVQMYIATTDAKRAIKIASERLGQVKAEEWKYPLLHEKCAFGEKGTNNVLNNQLRGLVAYPILYNRYPVYRFGTGELVINEDEEMIPYILVERKEEHLI
jgi:hypothetical protein